uniref:Nucleolar protein 6 n=1 Tax=Anthurium amnicola TaxID=1678845 RepID=A0A1D1YCT8_9ARAE
MGPGTDSMGLKVAELLKEVQLGRAAVEILDQAVSAVAEAIRGIPERRVGADAAPGFVRDIGVPAEKAEFTFRAPESVVVAGSRSIRSIAKPDVNVDLLVRMPKECFHEKDYLNHRYHAKRCLYLCVIEEHLRSSPTVRRTAWSTFQNEARKPVLLVFPDVELLELSGFFIRIIPAATSVFNISRLSLLRNNVRAHNVEGVTQATPNYNSSILEDMFLEENAEFVSKNFHEWRSLEEALVLLKVWARNRSSIYAHDCLNGFLISIILAYMAAGVKGNYFNKSMDALQIFRVSLNFIASSTSRTKGLLLEAPGQHKLSKEEMGQYLQLFDVVVCDASGCANLAFRLTRPAFLELQDEAALTFDCINHCRDGGFEEIFMTKVDFPAKFDLFMRINMERNHKVNASSFCLDGECWRNCEAEMHSLLDRALNDRARLVRVAWRLTPSEWDVGKGFSQFGHEPMLVGILFNSFEKISRVVDAGPNAENKVEATAFKKFWGEKAELRRFKDGTIAESTVWECEPWERHLIMKRITQYVLSKHFFLSNDDVVQIVDQLDFSLLHGSHDPILFYGSLMGAFELLSKNLRLLDGLPLKISSVQPLDPAFRYTSVFPPEPHPLADKKAVNNKSLKFALTCVQPLDIMIQLESSGLWPLDEVAIEKTKTAWLLEIAKRLQDRLDAICVATEDDVYVLISGYAFRLKVLHERGLKLLTDQAGNVESKGLSTSDRELFLRSQHSSMINGLQGRYPVYGQVVRLGKRWITSHLFSCFLSEEVIELLVAYLFLKPFPFCIPCSRITGFLRFLRLLANYDWTFSPLVIDINNDLTLEDKKQINEKFIFSRRSHEENVHDVEPAMFLATSYDKFSEAWTKFSPKTSVLKRLVRYAQSSADFLTNLIIQGQSGPYTWECLFRTPLNNYDAVVLLYQDKLCYPQRLLFPTDMKHGKHVIRGKASSAFQPYLPLGGSKNLEDVRNILMVGFDPTRCFVEDLKKEFPSMFKVWYDSLGGDAIGLTWEKQDSKKRDREDADANRGETSCILKDVGEIGKGFVRSVYLLKAPRLQL